MVLYFDGTSWICKQLNAIAVVGNWDIGAFKFTASQLASDVAIGTAPLLITSTTLVSNLNADMLDGYEATAFVLKSLFDANTILAANADDTPIAITIGAQTIVGRITGGNIAALTSAQVMALLSGGATADFSMNTNKITSVKDPTLDQDAATKKYADDAIDTDIATHAAAGDPHTVYQKESEKGVASGYAGLDADTYVQEAVKKIRVANAAPGTPAEGDIYVDSVENAMFIAVG